MQLKTIKKRLGVLGLTLSLCVSNLTMVSATETSGVVTESKDESYVTGAKVEPSENTDEEKPSDTESETGPSEGKEQEKPSDTEGGSLKPDSEPAAAQPSDIKESQELENGEEEPEDITNFTETRSQKSFELTKAEFTDEKETEFEIEVSNCEMETGDSLKAGVWSEDKGQDDLKWVTLEKKAENTYGVKIKISDYKSPGEYVVHVYLKKKNGSEKYVTGKRFQVSKLTAGVAKVDKQTYEAGTASIKITGIKAPSGVKRVRVAVWSMADQKDLYWYNAVEKADGWYVDMDISKYHKNNWGIYTAHAYAVDGNGFEQYAGGTKVDFSVKSTPATITIDEKKQSVKIELDAAQVKTPGKVESIRCALWSEDKGQDDLKWHTLDYSVFTKKWTKEVPLSMFRSTGVCYAHMYIVKSDKTETFLGGNIFKLDSPTLKSVTADLVNKNGTFKITLKDLKTPLGYKKIEVAVWSQGNQSDLKWYDVKSQKDGTFTVDSSIVQHKYNIGKYYIHVYVTDGLGIRSYAGGTTMVFKSDVGKLSVKDDPKETSYMVTLPVNEYPAGLKEVRFGVWSNANGQDDLKWYKANKNGNNYQASVDIKNHKTNGTYSVHVYGVDQTGKQVFLAGHGALINVKGTASGKISVTQKDEKKGTFKVTLTNVNAPAGVSCIKLAAWTQSNQNDLHWYTCKKSGETWSAEVNISNHKCNSGTYYLHAYAVMGNQIESYAAGTSCKMELKHYIYVLNNQEKAKRTVGICNPSSTNNIRFAVWSETGGQDDLVWYPASQTATGNWSATIIGYNHKHGGKFNVHIYAGSACIGTTTFTMSADEVAKNGWFYEQRNGKEYKLYYVNNKLQTDVSGIIGRQSSYMAEINRVTCTVTIYAKDGAKGYIIPVKVFACSVGLPKTPTPLGTYYTIAKYRWAELMGPSYGQYCTRIVHGILFHSVAGNKMTSYNLSAAAYNMLGSPASHGCVRLCVRDAKWIYDNCSLGMETRIFDSSYPGPFGKPATIKIPAGQNWDPTDPNL